MIAWFALAGAAAAIAACSASATPVRTIRATATDLLVLADRLERGGQTGDAERILQLLAQDPSADIRNEARYRRSKLLIASGRERDAALLLRRILDDKPDATPVRLQLAQLLDRMGDKDGAWRQVRAAQAAGLPPAVARMVDRYSEALRAARPFGASFEIALAPDSNINRATRFDTLGTVLGDFDISKEGKARSGTGVALRGQAYRRFPLGGEGRQLLVRVSGFADLYGEGRFNDLAVDVAAGPELELGTNRINLEAGATQRWFGQKPFMRSARIGASWTRPLGRRSQLRASAWGALVDNQLNDLQDGKTWTGDLSIERALSATTGVALTASGAREALKDPGYSTKAWRLGALAWHDMGRLTITAQAQFGRLNADERLQLFPDKRRDRYSRFSIGATFRRLGFAGFAPVARFVVERNASSIAFYDYQRRRMEFGVERAF